MTQFNLLLWPIAGKATLILGIVALLSLAAGRRWPLGCRLWQRLGIVALAALPLVVCALPPLPIPLLPAAPTAVASSGASVPWNGSEPLPWAINPAAAPAAVPLEPASKPIGPQPTAMAHRSVSRPSVWSVSPAQIAAGALLCAYVLVALVLALRFVRGWLALRALRSAGVPIADSDWQVKLAHWSRMLGVRRPVALSASDSVSVAMTFGWRAPVILVPLDCVAGCSQPQREAILVHELTHIRNGDFFWHVCTQLTTALYWPHPLVWLLRHHETALRERICDALCVRNLGRALYAQALVQIAGRKVLRPAISLGLAMAHPSSLGKRLRDLTGDVGDAPFTSSSRARETLAVALALAVLAVIVGGAVTSRAAAQADKLFEAVSFQQLTADVNGVDWLVDAQTAAERSNYRFPRTVAESDLDDIAQREDAAMPKYTAAMQQVTTPDGQMRVFTTLDPRNLFAEEYLAFERKHRGTTEAVGAMYHVLFSAQGVGDPESAVARARIKLIEVIGEHYLQHEDADLLLGGFYAGSPVPAAKALFQKALASRHEWVRAEGLYRLAQFEAQKCAMSEMASQFQKMAGGDPESERAAQYVRASLERIGPIDVPASRRAATEALDRILREYPDVVTPYRTFERNFLRYSRGAAPPGAWRETFGQRAAQLRFRVVDLQPGAPAPELTGRTAQGDDVSLAQFVGRGRVTVLLFSSAREAYSPALRRDLTKLREEHPDQIDVLEVYVSNGDTDPAPAGNAWPVISQDDPPGPLSRKWSDHTPAVFIFNRQGRMHTAGWAFPPVSDYVKNALEEPQK